MKIKKGYKVKVLSGKDRGKEASVTAVLPRENQVVLEGLNLAKRHLKPSEKNPKGGIVEIAKPMPAAKVGVICPNCQKVTRIGFTFEGETKQRVCRKCGKVIK